MKIVKKCLVAGLILTSLMFTSSLVHAQIDQERMDKDLRVASKVLESLTHGDDRLMMYSDNVEGNYLEGYGVIFSIGGGYSFYVSTGGQGMTWSTNKTGVRSSGQGQTVVIAGDSNNNASNDNQSKPGEDMSKIMMEFLIDYSQMINQLKPTDKIIVSTQKSDYVYIVAADGDEPNANGGQAGITAELLKKDHNDYMAGKLTRAQLEEKVKVNKKNGEAARSKDLDLFSSMLSTVYDDEYTDSYFVSWKPEYQRLDGVGVIYSFKVYSSYDEDGLFRMPGVGKNGMSSEDRNSEVERLYPIFVESLKENIVQYGRTINSLKTNELLILKITLTKCDDCSIPKKIQCSVKQSVLSDYNLGKISEKDAIAKVIISDM